MLAGYPWWPAMVCDHPTLGRSQREGKVYVLFLGKAPGPGSRGGGSEGGGRRWTEVRAR